MIGDDLRSRRRRDIPTDLAIRFWSLVILAKFVILIVGAGVILAIFTQYRTIGLGVLAIGLASAGRWVLGYRRAKTEFGEPK